MHASRSILTVLHHRLMLAIVVASVAFTTLSGFLPMSAIAAQAHTTTAQAHPGGPVSVSLPSREAAATSRKTPISAPPDLRAGTTSAEKSCPGGDLEHMVAASETLSAIAFRTGTSWPMLASHNHLLQANLILVGQMLCIPTFSSSGSVAILQRPQLRTLLATGQGNFFPYGQCTWWASQRYYEMYGVYVPWTSNADAWQWTARAYDYGWHVSRHPTAGAIIDLQPWVQGAYGAGHVAVVEQVLSNGNVITSNMNWGTTPLAVVNVQFSPEPGVTFLTR